MQALPAGIPQSVVANDEAGVATVPTMSPEPSRERGNWNVNRLPAVADNQAQQRLELTLEGHVAELAYHRDGKRLVLVHTEVPGELEGRGIGGSLVAAAVQSAKTEGLVVVPECEFARGWLERHPKAVEGVSIDWPEPST